MQGQHQAHLETNFEISLSTLFIRFNSVEFSAERAPKGWLSVTSPVTGELIYERGALGAARLQLWPRYG